MIMKDDMFLRVRKPREASEFNLDKETIPAGQIPKDCGHNYAQTPANVPTNANNPPKKSNDQVRKCLEKQESAKMEAGRSPRKGGPYFLAC